MSKRQHTMSGTPSASGTVPYFDTASSSSSSTPPPSTSKATIKRYSTLPAARQLQNVAIVGAGIAGLSTALSLVRTGGVSASSITIYEPREALDSGQGAGLNLNSGAAILSKEYGINLQRNGINATRAYSTLSAAVIDNSKMMGTDDSTLPNDDDALFDIDLSTRFKHTYLAQNDGSAHVVTMLREDLQSELYSAVSDLGVTILRGPQYFVSGVTDERRIIFKNGNKSNVCYDLVVGADGVRSTVRDMVVEQRRKKRPRYTGIKVAWLITRRTVDDDTDSGLGIVPKGEMRQMVCDGGTVVAYAVSSQFEMIAYLYREPKSKSSSKDINENINYGTNENHKGGKHKNETMDSDSEGYRRERIVKHMMKAKVPPTVWKKFVSPGAGSRFIESAVFDHGLLSHWSRNQVVLVGDAGLFFFVFPFFATCLYTPISIYLFLFP